MVRDNERLERMVQKNKKNRATGRVARFMKRGYERLDNIFWAYYPRYKTFWGVGNLYF